MGHGDSWTGTVRTGRPQIVDLSEEDLAMARRVVDLTFAIGKEYKERGADVPVTYDQSKTFILAAAQIVAAERQVGLSTAHDEKRAEQLKAQAKGLAEQLAGFNRRSEED